MVIDGINGADLRSKSELGLGLGVRIGLGWGWPGLGWGWAGAELAGLGVYMDGRVKRQVGGEVGACVGTL